MSKYVSCTASSVQLGHTRFPDRHDRPQVKAWRCDLTALSRSHNFYFVACNDTIHVYEPQFPHQSISGNPELILHPPISSSDLQFGIDPEDLHSITRLHVDYLGQDEIILITCDDGDVIGYRTDEIQRVIDKQREASGDEEELPIEEPVRTFLHRNVGASAWGLAIHREARMIAVSANTEKVTVIAYALAQHKDFADDTSMSSDSELSECSNRENPKDFPSPRRQDHVITLAARHNVPSISFNNTGDDPTGRWLSSCSINGETLMWDLHHPQTPVRTIRLGFCASVRDPTKAPNFNPGHCACLRPSNFPHAIWNTMFLDANTAYEDPSVQELTLPKDHPLIHVLDSSKVKSAFSGCPRRHPLSLVTTMNSSSSASSASVMDISETESVASDEEDYSSSLSSGSTSVEESDHFEDAQMQLDATDVALDSQTFHDSVESSEDTSDVSVTVNDTAPEDSVPHPPLQQTIGNLVNHASTSNQPLHQNTITVVSDEGYSDSDEEYSDTDDGWSVPSPSQVYSAFNNLVRPTRPYCEVTTAFTLARQPHITSPLLIVTKDDVLLYQRPLDYVGDHSDPIIAVRQPLHPENRHKLYPVSGSHDRHCYATQIAELGIFIIASPIGRASIFSLTKCSQKTQGRPLYSFQLEYVLPFSNDDKTKILDLEGARLIGVAAGPVQGMLDKSHNMRREDGSLGGDGGRSGNRRWRLMMYFTDHTVLAFEVSRRREGMMPEVGELVV